MIRPGPRHRRRFGFTLIELLVVIVILGILISLLVPAVISAIRTAKAAAVTAEINALANALAAFKERYGDYPPSRIILCEDGFYNTNSTASLGSVTWFSDPNLVNGSLDTSGDARIVYSQTDLTYGQLAQRSVRFLRKFWPQFQTSTSGAIYNVNTGWPDFNGNYDPAIGPNTGVTGQYPDNPGVGYLLQGDECLTFFLGGIPNHTGSSIGMTGFAKLPSNPFQNFSQTSNRNASLFDFKGDRLIDDDGDGIPGYVDSLAAPPAGRFYAYFASYGNGGYDPNDVNFNELASDGSTQLGRVFQTTFSVPFGGSPISHISSFAPNPYTTSEPVPTAAGSKPATYENSNTFQIISAGADANYGFGGRYSPNDSRKLPINDGANTNPAGSDDSQRFRENDNLTNFTTGRLE